METMLEEFGCYTDFIPLEEGLTRINVKVKSNEESEINGQGPVITDTAIEALYQKLDKLTAGDVLVLAGSIPNTLPGDMYERIMERLQGKEIRIAVDATKDLLVNVLKYHPFLIKPNNHELGEIFGKVLESEADIVEYAKKLQEMGAVNVLVSMAGDGAILVTEDGTVSSKKPPKGTVVNSVGAGDSMVAGFLAGWLNTGDYEKALELGTAAGSATAFVSLACNQRRNYRETGTYGKRVWYIGGNEYEDYRFAQACSVELNGTPQTKEETIEQMVALMEKGGNVTDVEKYKAGVFAREEEGTTGIGEGIAIPHAKTDAVNAPGLAAMVIPAGVDYDALDGQPVDLVFLIAAPNTEDNVHLEVLSRLSMLLMDESFKQNLLKAKTVEEFLAVVDQAENAEK